MEQGFASLAASQTHGFAIACVSSAYRPRIACVSPAHRLRIIEPHRSHNLLGWVRIDRVATRSAAAAVDASRAHHDLSCSAAQETFPRPAIGLRWALLRRLPGTRLAHQRSITAALLRHPCRIISASLPHYCRILVASSAPSSGTLRATPWRLLATSSTPASCKP